MTSMCLRVASLVLWGVLVVGCDSGARPEPSGETGDASGNGDDTGQPPDEDTGESDTLSIERGECDALLDPWIAASASDALATWLLVSEGANFMTSAGQAAALGDEHCPVVTTESTETSTHQEIVGGCTAATGWSFAGTATVDVALNNGIPSSYHYVYAGFGADFDDGSDSLHFLTTGDIAIAAAARTFDLTWEASGAGRYADQAGLGNVTLLASAGESGNGVTASGYFRVRRSPDGPEGDACFFEDFPGMSDCGSAGTITLTGATIAEITWGEEPCGCHDVLLDGVDAGQACE
ncbi:hypothetical protein LBMAG42_03770 [Deltaproteobacteria bacterium]|nr:hypothetical protein LBMAG42_03770 [Deltaproteobacteria bacterium]